MPAESKSVGDLGREAGQLEYFWRQLCMGTSFSKISCNIMISSNIILSNVLAPTKVMWSYFFDSIIISLTVIKVNCYMYVNSVISFPSMRQFDILWNILHYFYFLTGQGRVIGEHIQSYVHHLEGCSSISCNLEWFVDNIIDIWIHPLGLVSNFRLKSGGTSGASIAPPRRRQN